MQVLQSSFFLLILFFSDLFCVAENYREIIQNGVPFLQIFPQMFHDENIAETFKLKSSQRNKGIETYELTRKDDQIMFLYNLYDKRAYSSPSLFNIKQIKVEGSKPFRLINIKISKTF